MLADSKDDAMTAKIHKMSHDVPGMECSSLTPTVLPDDFHSSEIARAISSFKLPRYREIPDISLYKDQLLAYIDGVLSPLSICFDDNWLTASMVNNYVKCKLIPAPVKKQYSREQISRLLITCIFKQFLPIASIDHLFRIQLKTYPLDIAYDYAATEIESALHSEFTSKESNSTDSVTMVTRESLLVRSAASAFASKAYLLGYLAYCGIETE